MRILILSDIHGNLSALHSVLEDASNRGSIDSVILLGDLIDYGMRSNDVIEALSKLDKPIMASLWGNHEDAVINKQYDHFSSERGVQSAKNTLANLDESSIEWIHANCDTSGMVKLDIDGKRVLAIHGNLDDPLWGKLAPCNMNPEAYADFDVVLSGHSHIPHVFDVLIPSDNPEMRNKKKITFVNPGSVGQPRNHDPRASYCIWDTESGISLNTVTYDIEKEQALFDGSVDSFYSERLAKGV